MGDNVDQYLWILEKTMACSWGKGKRPGRQTCGAVSSCQPAKILLGQGSGQVFVFGGRDSREMEHLLSLTVPGPRNRDA